MDLVEEKQSAVVYFSGRTDENQVWYRFDPNAEVGENTNIERVAQLCCQRESQGGWAVPDEYDLFWAGGLDLGFEPPTTSKLLLRHSPLLVSPRQWILESDSRKLPRLTPFIQPLDRKLYVVAGSQQLSVLDSASDWTKCGEVYDLDKKTWEYLNADFQPFNDKDYQAAVGLKDGTKMVFYNLSDPASILFLDLISAKIHHEDHPSFSLGIKSLITLSHVSARMTAVFREDTFYWFTYDLQMHAYDINLKTWFHSPTLITLFPPLKLDDPFSPVLVDLHNGKFLVVIVDQPGRLTIASIVAVKVICGSSLCLTVSVENFQTLSCDDSFTPIDGRPVVHLVDTGRIKAHQEAGRYEGKDSKARQRSKPSSSKLSSRSHHTSKSVCFVDTGKIRAHQEAGRYEGKDREDRQRSKPSSSKLSSRSHHTSKSVRLEDTGKIRSHHEAGRYEGKDREDRQRSKPSSSKLSSRSHHTSKSVCFVDTGKIRSHQEAGRYEGKDREDRQRSKRSSSKLSSRSHHTSKSVRLEDTGKIRSHHEAGRYEGKDREDRQRSKPSSSKLSSRSHHTSKSVRLEDPGKIRSHHEAGRYEGKDREDRQRSKPSSSKLSSRSHHTSKRLKIA